MRSDHELDAPPWLRVESTIMAAARQIRCLYDDRFSSLDLNLSQASLLAYVNEFGANSQTVLAERMGLGRASTGTMIDQMEERDLLQRLPDPNDRRVWLISITPDGQALVDRIASIDSVVRQELRVGISRTERQQLASLLVRIQQNLSRGFGQRCDTESDGPALPDKFEPEPSTQATTDLRPTRG